jgi:UTP--glucose-1-phosphate uridylyltransferase
MKGVIVTAGYGTRFLPVTKTIPKEMLPLVNRPSIDLIVEEFLRSGVSEILFITSRRKKALEDYFDREVELESFLGAEKDDAGLARIAPASARCFFVRQKEMRGTGHALLLCRPFVGKEPFVAAYPDDIVMGEKPLAGQLIETYNQTGCSVLATLHDPPDINRYGVVSIAADNLHVTGFVEKPAPGKEPSREASIGRFLYAPDFLDQLEREWENARRAEGEFWHMPALAALAQKNRVVFKRLEGERLDTGEPAGYIDAFIRYAEMTPGLRPAMDAAIDAAVGRRKSRG